MPITHTQLTIFFFCFECNKYIFLSSIHKTKEKTNYCYFVCVILTFICSTMIFARFDNPPIQAMMSENRIIFKKDEIIRFNNIKNITYFEDVELDLSANGYRWDNGIYYSGDAALISQMTIRLFFIRAEM